MQASILRPIIDQHAEEAAFLWLQRDAAVHEPHYNLVDLIQLDERLEAHIDGLRIAQDTGWEICKQSLETIKEPGEVFAAAVLAFEGKDGKRIEDVVKIAIDSPENWRALVSATGWISEKNFQRWIPGMLNVKAPSYKRLAIAACIIHRQDKGSALVTAIDDPEPCYQARALRAVGEMKRRDIIPLLHQRFKDNDTTCQFWAVWSAVLLGDKVAIDILGSFATPGSPFLEQAMRLILRVLGTAEATKWLNDFTQSPKVLRYALLGAGIIGDPLYVPWLIRLMAIPEVARVAGEAFVMITGVDLADDNLEGEWPAGFEVGPTDNPEDEDVAMDPDEDLPWPEQSLIHSWWEKNKNQFQAGVRHLAGRPATVEHCKHVLNTGLQRQRRAAALELALLEPDKPLFNTCAPGYRQQHLLQRQ